MDKLKKTCWEKPQLLVIVRSQPEEAVLITCKCDGWGDAQSTNFGCYQDAQSCTVCSTYGLS